MVSEKRKGNFASIIENLLLWADYPLHRRERDQGAFGAICEGDDWAEALDPADGGRSLCSSQGPIPSQLTKCIISAHLNAINHIYINWRRWAIDRPSFAYSWSQRALRMRLSPPSASQLNPRTETDAWYQSKTRMSYWTLDRTASLAVQQMEMIGVRLSWLLNRTSWKKMDSNGEATATSKIQSTIKMCPLILHSINNCSNSS